MDIVWEENTCLAQWLFCQLCSLLSTVNATCNHYGQQHSLAKTKAMKTGGLQSFAL